MLPADEDVGDCALASELGKGLEQAHARPKEGASLSVNDYAIRVGSKVDLRAVYADVRVCVCVYIHLYCVKLLCRNASKKFLFSCSELRIERKREGREGDGVRFQCSCPSSRLLLQPDTRVALYCGEGGGISRLLDCAPLLVLVQLHDIERHLELIKQGLGALAVRAVAL